MAVDWQAVRQQFPALENWTYLNTATFGQLPRRASLAMQRHLERRDELACHDFLSWFDDMDRLRGRIAQLFGCTAQDIAFIPNAAAALGLLLGGIDWRAGDRIVSLPHEFPNNVYYPSWLAARNPGVEFVAAPWERFPEAINARTRLVAVSTVNYSTGFRVPLEELAPVLQERGILLYVDGTQSAGALRFDVARIRPGMFAVHGYKWMLSPSGAGFLYVSPELRQRLPPSIIGWRSHRDWRRVDSLHHGAPEFPDAAERYEGGMINFPSLYGMAESVEMMLELGAGTIEQRVLELTEKCRGVLRALGGKLLSDGSPHYDSPVIAARFEGHDASSLAVALKQRRVLVSARHGNLRVSPHFYNNETDLARLSQELGALL